MQENTEEKPRPSAEAVLQQVHKERPHLAALMGFDRHWLWGPGPKPSDGDREYLKGLKFRFNPKDHALPDGTIGHWFYWDAIPPIHKRNGRSEPVRVKPGTVAKIIKDQSARFNPLAELPEENEPTKPQPTTDRDARIKAFLAQRRKAA